MVIAFSADAIWCERQRRAHEAGGRHRAPTAHWSYDFHLFFFAFYDAYYNDDLL